MVVCSREGLWDALCRRGKGPFAPMDPEGMRLRHHHHLAQYLPEREIGASPLRHELGAPRVGLVRHAERCYRRAAGGHARTGSVRYGGLARGWPRACPHHLRALSRYSGCRSKL